MELILYYNKQGPGYDFHQKGTNFPMECLPELRSICANIPAPYANAVAIRYQPLKQTHYYLLSVIFRQKDGDGIQARGINTVVNFLMDEKEADGFFTVDLVTQLNKIETVARGALQEYGIPLNLPEQEPPCTEKNLITKAQLFNAASYAAALRLSKQAYFILSTPTVPEVAAMISLLPPGLRKQVSFHTGIQSMKESVGIAVSFSTQKTLPNGQLDTSNGGDSNTDKYVYYWDADGSCVATMSDTAGVKRSNALLRIMENLPFPELTLESLVQNVSSWQELDMLLSIENAADPADFVLEMLPEDMLLNKLSMNQLSAETVQHIAQSKKLSRKTAEVLCCNFPLGEKTLAVLLRNHRISDDVVLSLFKNKLLSERSFLDLAEEGVFDQSLILKIRNNCDLSEEVLQSLSEIARARHMTELKKSTKASLKQIEQKRKEEEKQRRAKQPEPQPMPKHDQADTAASGKKSGQAPIQTDYFAEPTKKASFKEWISVVLTLLLKLAVLGALVWGAVLLFKSLLTVSSTQNDQTVVLVFSVASAHLIWKVLGLSAIVAAISAFVTHHLTLLSKQKSKKNQKNKQD